MLIAMRENKLKKIKVQPTWIVQSHRSVQFPNNIHSKHTVAVMQLHCCAMMNDTATTLLADSKASSAPPTNVDQPMTTAITGPSSTVPPEEESERMRFQIELEFVQGLANPDYLHCKPFTLNWNITC